MKTHNRRKADSKFPAMDFQGDQPRAFEPIRDGSRREGYGKEQGGHPGTCSNESPQMGLCSLREREGRDPQDESREGQPQGDGCRRAKGFHGAFFWFRFGREEYRTNGQRYRGVLIPGRFAQRSGRGQGNLEPRPLATTCVYLSRIRGDRNPAKKYFCHAPHHFLLG